MAILGKHTSLCTGPYLGNTHCVPGNTEWRWWKEVGHRENTPCVLGCTGGTHLVYCAALGEEKNTPFALTLMRLWDTVFTITESVILSLAYFSKVQHIFRTTGCNCSHKVIETEMGEWEGDETVKETKLQNREKGGGGGGGGGAGGRYESHRQERQPQTVTETEKKAG